MNGDDIASLRDQIDGIDHEIVHLLDQRAQAARSIGKLKTLQGLPLLDPSRERELMLGLLAGKNGNLPKTGLRNIFTEIISACRAVQAPTKVSYLGPEGTFTHLAAGKHFGRSAELVAQGTIPDVFKAIETGRTDFGVVPVENSTEGSVGATLDQLAVSDIRICGEVYSRIAHALMSKETSKDCIDKVYSHPQALAQCMGWLSANLTSKPMVPVASTAAAALQASQEPGTGAVGSAMLADIYGLNVLAGDIQDLARNQTRFLILSRTEPAAGSRDKTSVVFSARHKPGALLDALKPLAERGINLSKIESRPAKDKPWEYIFFVDFEGHSGNETVKEALSDLDTCVARLKVLGSYPAGDPPDGP